MERIFPFYIARADGFRGILYGILLVTLCVSAQLFCYAAAIIAAWRIFGG